MSDLINRQAAIQEIGKIYPKDVEQKFSQGFVCGLAFAIKRIEQMDSVVPDDVVSKEKYDKLKNRYMLCKWEKMCLEVMLPTDEVIEVVRCKDCKHWDTDWIPQKIKEEENGLVYWCSYNDRCVAEDFFCGYGERKKNEMQSMVDTEERGIE